MNETTVKRQNLIDVINNLPDEVLLELASFLDYLRYKASRRESSNFSKQLAPMFSKVKIQGTPGHKLLKFAGSIPPDDLTIMQNAIEQDCGQIDLDGW